MVYVYINDLWVYRIFRIDFGYDIPFIHILTQVLNI